VTELQAAATEAPPQIAAGSIKKGGVREARPARLNGWAVTIVPGLAFLMVFFIIPLGGMVWRSFTDPGPETYRIFVEHSIYLKVLWTTLRMSAIVTVASLLLGYPYAYVMLRAGSRMTAVLGALVLVPFWSSILVRTYAWTVLLQDSGVINSTLQRLHLIDAPLALMRNDLGVTIGMSHILLPFMVFPMYAVMLRVDPDVVPAAESLGARPWRAFVRVFWPLSLPGVFAGSLLVFVLSIGFYITPALLGSPSNTMYSVLVVDMVSRQLQFGNGSAMGVVLLVVTLALLWVGTRVVRLGDVLGVEIGQ
jgi:putative spermidine/putrescine transport system permease protein